MNITVHIDQITVEGPPLTRREREHLAATLEQELTRLLREQAAGRPARGPDSPGGRPPQPPPIPGGSLSPHTPSAPLGSRIARELLAALPAGTFGRRRGRVLPKAAR
jgi:hypothetical protein